MEFLINPHPGSDAWQELRAGRLGMVLLRLRELAGGRALSWGCSWALVDPPANLAAVSSSNSQERSGLLQHLRDSLGVPQAPEPPKVWGSGVGRRRRAPGWVPAHPQPCCSEGMGEVPGVNPGPAEYRTGWNVETPARLCPPSPNLLPSPDLLGESQRSTAWEKSSPDLAGGLQAQTHITHKGCLGLVKLRANYDINIIRTKEPKSLGKIPDCRGRAQVREPNQSYWGNN